jgi:thioglycine synthase
VRAITELSQTRAANIQGARDDIEKTQFEQDDPNHYQRYWEFMRSEKTIKFSDVKTYTNRDILEDIKLILGHLREAGFRRAIVVDLTNSSTMVPVVRVIVPGLESFYVTKSVMGRRALNCFKKALI